MSTNIEEQFDTIIQIASNLASEGISQESYDELEVQLTQAKMSFLDALRRQLAERTTNNYPLIDALEKAGMGKPGNPNTLTAMVYEIIQQLEAARAELNQAVYELDKAKLTRDQALEERDAAQARIKELELEVDVLWSVAGDQTTNEQFWKEMNKRKPPEQEQK